ncbi:type II CAAX prenyl endopeptidase Rce1 family protein [Microbacterium sp. NPDC089695]|uniref:CPBP family glutamic-type intramembrane protease n=1 Tax=Microbacterium sp. NPDC089695 TaxID=3364198 RepID=UPI00381BF278
MDILSAGSPRSAAESVGIEYHRVLAGEKRRIGRGILAILLLLGGLFGAIQVFYLLGEQLDRLLGIGSAETQVFSPVSFATSTVATALMIPWSMVIQRWLYGVRGPSLHSVVNGFRFGVFGRAVLVVVPLFVVALAVTEIVDTHTTTPWSKIDIIAFFLVVMLLVPLQAAGEEYGLRGLVFRVAGSWTRGRRGSLLLGIVVSAAVFAVIHTAADPWWNVF